MQIDEKLSPGGPWGCLGWSWRLPGHGRDTFWEKNGNPLKSGPLFTDPEGGQGTQLGPKNRLKTLPGLKMDVQRRSSERFSTDFYLDHRFSR